MINEQLDEKIDKILIGLIDLARDINIYNDVTSEEKQIQDYCDHTRPAIKHLIQKARIESLQWALNDYNMPDTDTKYNLEQFIKDLSEQL